MLFSRLSRLSFNLFCFVCLSWVFSSAQQKANDFTKRLTLLEGKQSRLSGRFFSSPRLSEAYSKKIKIEEWPGKYSPFGGKRFTTHDVEGLIKKRVPFDQIEKEPAKIPDKVMGSERKLDGLDYDGRYTSSATVEFRDAYYAKLNQRVDEWMEKVNNLSLRDLNRFQFRRGRSAEPGFPVQRAGSDVSGGVNEELPLKALNLTPNLPTNYRLGPRQITTNTDSGSKGTRPQEPPESSTDNPGSVGQKLAPVPKLGPKKIRVQVRPVE